MYDITYSFFLLKYLLCLPISPINASHYDMTRLCPIAIDYNIFNVLHYFQAKTNYTLITHQKAIYKLLEGI